MKYSALTRVMPAAGLSLALLAATSPAARATTCFTAFGGDYKFSFHIDQSRFATNGTYLITGITYGKQTACAGLSEWPVIGTLVVSDTQEILAFRAMTVDKASCGAIDYIVTGMTKKSLNGTTQLHNDRTNYSSSSAFDVTTCGTPPAASAAPKQGRDQSGNGA